MNQMYLEINDQTFTSEFLLGLRIESIDKVFFPSGLNIDCVGKQGGAEMDNLNVEGEAGSTPTPVANNPRLNWKNKERLSSDSELKNLVVPQTRTDVAMSVIRVDDDVQSQSDSETQSGSDGQKPLKNRRSVDGHNAVKNI